MGFVETLRGMSDAELLGSLDRAVGRGRRITAEALAHLGEVEARRLYLDAACSSLFAYCTERLRLDEGAAYKRILAARVARRFPMILQMVSDGSLHLAGIGLLAPHLTPMNYEELLAVATNKSKREIEALVADRAPRPPVPSTIRRLPGPSQPRARQAPLDLSDNPRGAGDRSGAPEVAREPSPSPSRAITGAGPRASAISEDAQAPGSSSPAASSPAASHSGDPAVTLSQLPSAPQRPLRPEPPAPRVRGTVAPLGNRRYRVELTASDALVGKLERARALLSHKVPGSDIADVIEQALTELVERLEKERFGVRGSGKPRGRAKATLEAKRRAKIGGCGCEAARRDVAKPPADGREPADEDHAPRLATSPAVPGGSSGGEAEGAAGARAARSTVPGASSRGEAEEAAGAGGVPVDSSGGLAGSERVAGEGEPPTVPGGSSRAPLGPRRVPMAVRRAVYERDGARCMHTDAEGRRCNATHHLQLDHIVPWARGGASTVSNIRLLCRQHNLHAARRSFGAGLIDRRIERARSGGR